ncbi:MAG: hypothetical protein ACI8V2_003697 [Candidatus Latescibacterota bacterium]|jgi:hypothetical protein
MAERAHIYEVATDAVFERGVTFRSVATGLSIVVFVNVWVTYAETVVHASRLNLSVLQLALLAVFLVLVAGVNPIGKWLFGRAIFYPSELLAIVAIGLVGCAVPASGVTGFLIGVISSPFYFATPENGWAEFYHPNLHAWIVPTNTEALRMFFEGLPPGVPFPWSVWLIPLAWWTSLIAATFAVSASIMVILRKQWADNEKLVYPLVAVPIEMIEQGDEQRFFPNFMQGKMFWVGAIIPFLLFAWMTLSWAYPVLPDLGIFPHAGKFTISRYAPGFYVEPLNLFTIGIAYFANTEVLFSIWFFFLLHVVEGGIFNRLGYQIEQSIDSFSADPPTEAYQCFGALAFLVVWRLWVARHHLRDVFLKALNNDHPVDDSQEVLSYRTAVITLFLGLAYAIFWLNQVGMDFVTTLVFLFAVGVIYIGIARIVCEAGVVYSGATITPQAFVMDMRGTSVMSNATLTALALSYSLIDYMRGLFTPGVAHSVKLGDLIRGNRRALLFWAGISAVLGLAASVSYTLYLGYTDGAYNFPRFPFFSGDPKGIYESTLVQMRTPKVPDPERMAFFGIGAGLMALLTFLRYRFSWWPLHPIGLTLSAADNTAHLVLPVFIAWVCKSIVMRVGGVVLYRQIKPLFLGLLVGYTAGVVWCFIVDAIWWSGQGHLVHYW